MAVAILAGTVAGPGCSLPSPVVVVDTAHSQVGQPEGRKGVHYVVAPAPRISGTNLRTDW